MKTAGSILSKLFDEGFMKKAHGVSKLFDSWADITAKNRIAAAGDHSRIKDLENGILLIETDHPGWKQILQTKQEKLLHDFRYRFPELNITGIALKLGGGEPQVAKEEPALRTAGSQHKDTNKKLNAVTENVEAIIRDNKSIEEIKDEAFKEKLKKLERTIADREIKVQSGA